MSGCGGSTLTDIPCSLSHPVQSKGSVRLSVSLRLLVSLSPCEICEISIISAQIQQNLPIGYFYLKISLKLPFRKTFL